MQEKTLPAAGDAVPAISLWEPWASLMRTGAKTIETRSWLAAPTGWLLICASKRRNKGELVEALGREGFQRGLAPLLKDPFVSRESWPVASGWGLRPEDLLFGHAVALVDFYRIRRTADLSATEVGKDLTYGDYSVGRYAWLTRSCHVFEPFPVTGHQGIFTVRLPDDFLPVPRVG